MEKKICVRLQLCAAIYAEKLFSRKTLFFRRKMVTFAQNTYICIITLTQRNWWRRTDFPHTLFLCFERTFIKCLKHNYFTSYVFDCDLRRCLQKRRVFRKSKARMEFRVARWYIFKPKIPIWVNFGGPWNGKYWYILCTFGIYYCHFVFFIVIW
jgi:hypothetical protein